MLGAGWMPGHYSWTSIFYVTAALSALTLMATVTFVPNTRSSEHVGLDPVGTVLSALAVGGLVLGIIEGPIHGWSDPITLVGLVAGAVFGVVFILWELRVAHPLLDPRLFRLRGFATGSAAMLVLFAALFGIFLVLLQYMQLLSLSPYAQLPAGARPRGTTRRPQPFPTALTNPDNPWGFDFPPTVLVK